MPDIYARRKRRAEVQQASVKAAVSTSAAPELDPEFQANNIQLDNGEWVSKAGFESLSIENQALLKRLGVEGFNNYQRKEEEKFKADNVKLETGEWISRQYYDQLNDENKTKLNSLGVEGFNRWQQQQFEEFKTENIQLTTGEWINKDQYNNMPGEWQQRIKSLGVQGFQTWLPGAYSGATEYMQYLGSVYGTNAPGVSYPYAVDANGNRVWVGGQWPDSATSASMGVDALSGRWPDEVKNFNPVTPLTHVQLDTGEWVTKALYSEVGKVSKEGQKVLKEEGVESYESWQRSEGEVVTVEKGEKISQQVFDQLSDDDKRLVRSKGIDAVFEKLPGGQMISKASIAELAPKYQKILKEKGYQAYQDKLQNDTYVLPSGERVEKESWDGLPSEMQKAAWKNGLKAIDISELKPDAQFQMMKEWKLVEKDAVYAGTDKDGNILIKSKDLPDDQPWYQKYLNKETLKGVGIGVIPIAGTVYHWKNMKAWEKGLSIGLDVLTFIPVAGAVATGVRAGGKVGAVLGRVALAEIKAPITAITRPVATFKTAIRPISTLLSPKKLPIAAAELKSYILKIPKHAVDEIGDATSAMHARDALTDLALKGERPVIEVNGKTFELGQTAMQQKLEVAMAHNTPDGRFCLEGCAVKEGREGLGLFVEPYMNVRLTRADAFGRGFIPSFDVGAFEWQGRHIRKIGRYAPGEVARMDTPAIRSVNLADANNIPSEIARPLQNYIARENGTIVGSFSEWLKVKGAKRPNDVDLNFTNPMKARNDIADICREAGYETNIKESAVLIKGKNGKVVEVGNVKAARKVFFDMHGIDYFETGKIDGVNVIPLGEQYLRQGFGAMVAEGKNVDTFRKRIEHMLKSSKELRQLIGRAKLSERMPGVIVIRDEKLLAKTQPSGKLYRGELEIEKTVKPGMVLDKPSQILEMADIDGSPIYMFVIGKPFTPAQILKMKIVGIADNVRDMFGGRKGLKIDGKAVGQVDELSRIAEEARAIQDKVDIARAGKKADDVSRLEKELALLNQRSRALTRNIDRTNAARASMRPIGISTGEFIDKLTYRDAARRNIQEFAQRLSGLPVETREKVLKEVDNRDATRIRTEINRLPTSVVRAERANVNKGISPLRPYTREAARDRVVDPLRITRAAAPRIPGSARETRAGIPKTATPARAIPTAIPGTPRIPRDTDKPKIIKIQLPGGKERVLEGKQAQGAVGWKQGFIYKITYPPYENPDIINTKKPVPGIEYHEDIGSAAKSIAVLYGTVPDSIKRDMGIVDVIIEGKGEDKPIIKFKSDLKQKTRGSGRVATLKRG